MSRLTLTARSAAREALSLTYTLARAAVAAGVGVAVLVPAALPVDRLWVGVAVLTAVVVDLGLEAGSLLLQRRSRNRQLLAAMIPSSYLAAKWSDILERHSIAKPVPPIVVYPDRGPSVELACRGQHTRLEVGSRLASQPESVLDHTLTIAAARYVMGAHHMVQTAWLLHGPVGRGLRALGLLILGLTFFSPSNENAWLGYVVAASTFIAGAVVSQMAGPIGEETYRAADRVAAQFMHKPLPHSVQHHLTLSDDWETTWCEPEWADRGNHPDDRFDEPPSSLFDDLDDGDRRVRP